MDDLRWYQREAVNAAWDYLRTKAGNPVIVAPTGAGKSHMLAQLARDAVSRWNGRVLILAHRKELLLQNAAKLGMDAGLHSAGLGKRDTDQDIVLAGIQSAFRKPDKFGWRDLVIVDEAHLVPHDGEGMYRTFLDGLRNLNVRLRVIGLTATPYRLDSGTICRPESGIFTRCCYSVPIQRLIAEGFLCQLISRAADTKADLASVSIRGGEFVPGEMADAYEQVAIPACLEIVAKTRGRKSVLVFAAGVQHAYMLAEELQRMTGEPAAVVVGDTPPLERQSHLESFRDGRLRWLVNCNVLTEGFDAPCIDAIAVVRATLSPGLFAQMVGRGFRVSPTKEDCLILDFGGNVARHGPIDAPDYGVSREPSRGGPAPVKICPKCYAEVPAGRRECECGHLFPEPERQAVDSQASEAAILSAPEDWEVVTVRARRWQGKGKEIPTMRVDYDCLPVDRSGNLAGQTISEWVCLEHEGYARQKASGWWLRHSREPMPDTVDEAVRLFDLGAVARPNTITTVRDGRWQRVTVRVLDAIPEYDLADLEQAAEDPFAEEVVEF